MALAIGALILATHDLARQRPRPRLRRLWPVLEPAARAGPTAVRRERTGLLPGAAVDRRRRGRLWPRTAVSRRRSPARTDSSLIGVAALALFVILRGSNLYGDPRPWSPQPTPTMTALSFLNVSKYPPSLLYALVTLGPAVMLLPVLERLGGAVGESSPFSVRRRCFSMSCIFTPLLARPWRSNWRAASAWGKWRLSPPAERRRKVSASASWGLCRLDRDCRGALPALPLVRALQTTPARLVDHLLVSAARATGRHAAWR